MSLEHSRLVRLAAEVSTGGEGELRTRMQNGKVHVSIDPAQPGTELTARVLITTLRRLPIHLSLSVAGLAEGIVETLRERAAEVDPDLGLDLVNVAPADATVRLHVGSEGESGAIRILGDGYGAHIARNAQVTLTQKRRPHPLGAIWAAALGATEAFKDVAGVSEAKRVDHSYLRWCPVSLSDDLEDAAMLPGPMRVDAALLGCGAIGTAIGLILSEMAVSGQMLLADRQTFAPENLGTYSLGGKADVAANSLKIDLIARILAGCRVTRWPWDIEGIPSAIDRGEVHWPSTVLCGLDSREARHAAQHIWPDRLIDGQTGGTAVGMVEILGEGRPCELCFFPIGPASGNSTLERIAELTGLPMERLERADEPLRREEISHLGPVEREFLQKLVGTAPCGWVDVFGLTGSGSGYLPAGPFVSLQAACLVVGRLVRRELGDGDLPNFIQYDSLLGPKSDGIEYRRPLVGCYCQERASVVARTRQVRREAALN